LTNSKKAKIEEAKAQLEKDSSPASWKKVAPKYSSDPTTSAKGGLQPGLTEEFVTEEPLRGAIFDTPVHQLVGPIKYETNYLLLEPVKVTPPRVETVKEATPQITSTLKPEMERTFVNNYSKEFQARWTARTYCADGFIFERCANFAGPFRYTGQVSPTCYGETSKEENSKKETPAECPSPVLPIKPALPGTVTILKPQGEPFFQHPVPEVSQKTEDEEAKTAAAEAKREEAAGE
jgi:hypothetical protein